VTKSTGSRKTAGDNAASTYKVSIQDAGLTARDRSAQKKTKLPNLSLNGTPGITAGVEAGQGH